MCSYPIAILTFRRCYASQILLEVSRELRMHTALGLRNSLFDICKAKTGTIMCVYPGRTSDWDARPREAHE